LCHDEKKEGFSHFLSSDTSQLDAFIERKLQEAGRSLGDARKTQVMMNPPADQVIQEGDGVIVIP